MRKKSLFLVLVLMWVMMAACATLQEKWNKATPQEKSRITISQFQMSVKEMLDAGGLFVDQNPTYRPQWKEKVLPIFKTVNGILDQFILDLDQGKAISFTTIISAVSGKIGEITAIINVWGVKAPKTGILLMIWEEEVKHG
jgi:hypothetical protein